MSGGGRFLIPGGFAPGGSGSEDFVPGTFLKDNYSVWTFIPDNLVRDDFGVRDFVSRSFRRDAFRTRSFDPTGLTAHVLDAHISIQEELERAIQEELEHEVFDPDLFGQDALGPGLFGGYSRYPFDRPSMPGMDYRSRYSNQRGDEHGPGGPGSRDPYDSPVGKLIKELFHWAPALQFNPRSPALKFFIFSYEDQQRILEESDFKPELYNGWLASRMRKELGWLDRFMRRPELREAARVDHERTGVSQGGSGGRGGWNI